MKKGSVKLCTSVNETATQKNMVYWSTTYSRADNSPFYYIGYVDVKYDKMPQLGQIKSLSTDMDYKFTYSDDTSAFVYYDLVILKHDTSEKASYIVRVWLAKLGDAKSSSDNDAKPTQVTISDVVYDLYTGHNGNAPEYTFVVTMKTHNFHGNLMDFINYLTKAKSLDSSHYLATNLAGIQVFDSTQGTTTMSNFSASIQLA